MVLPLALPRVAEPDLDLLGRDAHLGREQLARRARRERRLLEESLESIPLLGALRIFHLCTPKVTYLKAR